MAANDLGSCHANLWVIARIPTGNSPWVLGVLSLKVIEKKKKHIAAAAKSRPATRVQLKHPAFYRLMRDSGCFGFE